jgi:hypothetical protein
MPVTAVENIIKGSLRLVGVRSPTAEQKNETLEALNAFLGALDINAYNIYVNTKEELTLVASQGTYTLGVGGDLNSARPESIVTVYWQDSTNDQDIFVHPITEPEYDDITDKTVEGRPTRWFLASEYPLAKLYLNPVPDGADKLKITSRKPFTVVELNDSFTLPNGYDRMLKFNLAVEIAPEHDAVLDPMVIREAAKSLNEIQRKNAKLLKMVSDVPRGHRTRFKRPFNINILE